jgi:hypothetical protein
MGAQGSVKICEEIFEEIKDGPKDEEKDLLFAWIQEAANKEALLLEGEEPDQETVDLVVARGYANDLTDDEIEKLGRDPFLLAYAMRAPLDRCVVTVEVSKPKKIRANRKIPDVCKSLGLACCDPHAMNRSLKFRTDWMAS